MIVNIWSLLAIPVTVALIATVKMTVPKSGARAGIFFLTLALLLLVITATTATTSPDGRL